MQDEEYYRILEKIKRGASVLSACDGKNAKRMAFLRLKKKKEAQKQADESKLKPKPKPRGRGEEKAEHSETKYINFEITDEMCIEAISGWKGLPKFQRELWRSSMWMALHPDYGPHYTQVHMKMMATFNPEFREKSTKGNFTPDAYAKALEVLCVRPGVEDKIIGYEDRCSDLITKTVRLDNIIDFGPH